MTCREWSLDLQHPVVFQAAPHDGCVFREFANQRLCANPAAYGGSQRGPHREQHACDSNESVSAASVRSQKTCRGQVALWACRFPIICICPPQAEVVTHWSHIFLNLCFARLACSHALRNSKLEQNGQFWGRQVQLTVAMNKTEAGDIVRSLCRFMPCTQGSCCLCSYCGSCSSASLNTSEGFGSCRFA